MKVMSGRRGSTAGTAASPHFKMASYRALLLSLVAVTLGSRVLAERSDCATSKLQACMDLLQAISQDHNIAFASTEIELKNMCRTMQTGLECVHGHVSKCFEEQRRQVIYQLLMGTEEVIQLLCTPGPFREKYQLHAPCMKNLSTNTSMCGRQYQSLIYAVSPEEKISYDDSIKRQCCAFHTYLMCVTSTAETECSANAAQFIEEYSYRTAGPLIKTRCKEFVPGSEMCTSRSSTNSVSPISRFCILCFVLTSISLVY